MCRSRGTPYGSALVVEATTAASRRPPQVSASDDTNYGHESEFVDEGPGDPATTTAASAPGSMTRGVAEWTWS
jgi:hypothetical protein